MPRRVLFLFGYYLFRRVDRLEAGSVNRSALSDDSMQLGAAGIGPRTGRTREGRYTNGRTYNSYITIIVIRSTHSSVAAAAAAVSAASAAAPKSQSQCCSYRVAVLEVFVCGLCLRAGNHCLAKAMRHNHRGWRTDIVSDLVDNH